MTKDQVTVDRDGDRLPDYEFRIVQTTKRSSSSAVTETNLLDRLTYVTFAEYDGTSGKTTKVSTLPAIKSLNVDKDDSRSDLIQYSAWEAYLTRFVWKGNCIQL